ncbi:MAG: TonB-dependent receptor [Novosphingobium sp.]
MKKTIAPLTTTTRILLGCSAAVLALAMPAMAHAQEEAQAATDEPDYGEGDGNEIVVTATKREQTLQDVPVAVSVTTAATIERAQIRDLKDISSVVPSLRVAERQTSANTNFFIRGFGNGANNAGIEPSVGVFIDGVYRSRSAAQIADLPDVQRVEVLRGPQSTLFGKNASAGVISITTQSPKFTFGGNLEASYGNYNALVVKGVVTGPLSEKVAASFSAGYNKRDGYNDNPITGVKVNDRNRWFIRGQLLFEPSTDLKIRLIGDYGKIDEVCCGVFAAQTGPATAGILVGLLGGKVNSPSQLFDNTVYFNTNPTNKIENYGFSGQIDYEHGPLTFTSITAYRKVKLLSNFDIDFTSADLLNGANISRADFGTFTQEFRVNANFVDRVNVLLGAFYFNEKVEQDGDLTWGTAARPFANALVSASGQSIAGLEALFGGLSGNNYAGKFFAAGQGLAERDTMKNENFSIFGQVDFKVTDRLTLTGGLNYTNDKKRYSVSVASNDVFAGLNIPALRDAATNFGISQGVSTALGNPNGNGLATPAQIAFLQANNLNAYNFIVGQAQAATLPLLGLRPLQFLPPILGVPNAVEDGRTSDNKVTYTARLAYEFSDQINGYVSYATGYKASSINLSRDSRPPASLASALTAAGAALPNQQYGTRFAGPENSRVIEAGLKGSWRNASVNIAVFQQNIKGFQSNIFTGTGFVLANAEKQSVWGVEFEGQAKPTRGLTLGLSMTFLHPKYDSFTQSAFGDATGIRPSDIPSFSGTVSVDYDHPLANDDRILFHADFHHESKVQVIEGLPAFIQRNPITQAVINFQPGLDAAAPFTREVNELNMSLTYAMKNGIEITAWGRNITDNRYINTIFDSPAQQGSVSAYTNQPRTWGGAIRFRW